MLPWQIRLLIASYSASAKQCRKSGNVRGQKARYEFLTLVLEVLSHNPRICNVAVHQTPTDCKNVYYSLRREVVYNIVIKFDIPV